MAGDVQQNSKQMAQPSITGALTRLRVTGRTNGEWKLLIHIVWPRYDT